VPRENGDGIAMDTIFPRLENTPLADRVREAILDAILAERFEDGRLPSEEELARMLNVSRTTIRTALHSLEQDGIISRRRAIGTTVNQHVGPAVLALQRLIGFDRLLKEKGHEVNIDFQWSRGTPPADLAAIFGMEPAEECFLTEKRFFADGDLAIYLRDAVPWANVAHELEGDLQPTLFEFSARHLREPIDHATVELVPMVKRDDETTKLPIDAGEVFMRLHERHYSSTGHPLGFSAIDVDDAFIRFEVFRRR
jgi:GntR family transcriptional regulator